LAVCVRQGIIILSYNRLMRNKHVSCT